MMKIFVLVASVGRAELTRRTVDLLADQTRPPDGVIVVSVVPDDVVGVATARTCPEIVFGPKGSCHQRNLGLDLIESRADIVIFFDDDFIPAPNYLEEVERMFADRPDLVGATARIIADGIHGSGYSFEEGVALISADRSQSDAEKQVEVLYGCNMAMRMSALAGIRFDEALPLYAWQEDVDFAYQVGKRGVLIKSHRLAGVHLGTKRGRTSGLRFGYSQIANPVYLLRKKTIPRKLAYNLLRQNVIANLVKSFWSEPYIDRRGRLRGNLIAIKDLILGRIDPQRILSFH